MDTLINIKARLPDKAKIWILRFIKFNVVGFTVFLIATAIYALAFSTFGFWTWLVANGAGSILQFTLITVVNRTNRGRMFNTDEQKRQEAQKENEGSTSKT